MLTEFFDQLASWAGDIFNINHHPSSCDRYSVSALRPKLWGYKFQMVTNKLLERPWASIKDAPFAGTWTSFQFVFFVVSVHFEKKKKNSFVNRSQVISFIDLNKLVSVLGILVRNGGSLKLDLSHVLVDNKFTQLRWHWSENVWLKLFAWTEQMYENLLM